MAFGDWSPEQPLSVLPGNELLSPGASTAAANPGAGSGNTTQPAKPAPTNILKVIIVVAVFYVIYKLFY